MKKNQHPVTWEQIGFGALIIFIIWGMFYAPFVAIGKIFGRKDAINDYQLCRVFDEEEHCMNYARNN